MPDALSVMRGLRAFLYQVLHSSPSFGLLPMGTTLLANWQGNLVFNSRRGRVFLTNNAKTHVEYTPPSHWKLEP